MAMNETDRARAMDAFAARDRTADGAFVVAVKTTGIYCRPSCPARRPRPENLVFYRDGEAARAAGYRACQRCRPDDAARDTAAVARALDAMAAAARPLPLEALAALTGYAPHHFHRIFKRQTGVTPASWQRALRAGRLAEALRQEDNVTDAIYAAGYEVPSRAYAEAGERLGMTPSAWKAGGKGETIRFATVATSLGPLLVAATQRGLCRIAFDEDEVALTARFPNATLIAGDECFANLLAQVVALVDGRGHPSAALPLDMRGTAFQQAVWAALSAIPAGETRTYAQLAVEVGKPAAVRAAGSACGDNPLAVLVPCHRVLRSDGGLGGYAYGLDRKRALLAREGSGPDRA